MKILIMTDDNSGFTHEEAKELGVYILRMPIIIDNGIYFQDENIDNKTFYEKLKTSNVSTSQPSIGELTEIWEAKLKEYDQIVHIPMSSGLSNSCATAITLANEYPNRVFVVDNHRISVTLKQSVRDALTLVKNGKTGLEIKEILEKEAYQSTIYIMLNTLKYLKRGGRITPAAALIGETLHLKPVLTILGEKLDSFQKCIGTKKAKDAMIKAIDCDIERLFKDIPKDQLYFGIAYTAENEDDMENVKLWKDAIENHFELSNIETNPLSLSVATHIGPGALAITIAHIIK